LQRFLTRLDGEALDAQAVESWLRTGGDGTSESRRRRLSTLRRLLALTPGAEAESLAAWLDSNRRRLIGRDWGGKVVSLHSPDTSDRELAERYAKQARRWYQEGGTRRVRALARRALRLDPCCLEAHALLGSLELDNGRPEQALRQFRQALVLGMDPGERRDVEGIAEVLYGLGQTLVEVRCFSEAYEVFQRLRFANAQWHQRCAPVLGRIAMRLDRPAEAADWFGGGAPVDQFSACAARILDGDLFRASIAFYRGLLTNLFVPAALLPTAERRFENAFSFEDSVALDDQASTYVAQWRELWARWPELLPTLRRLWDHAATRTFLMRAVPLIQREPGSAKLAVLVHTAASEVRKSEAAGA